MYFLSTLFRHPQIQFAAIAIALVSFLIPHTYDAYDTDTAAPINGSAAFPKNFKVDV